MKASTDTYNTFSGNFSKEEKETTDEEIMITRIYGTVCIKEASEDQPAVYVKMIVFEGAQLRNESKKHSL